MSSILIIADRGSNCHATARGLQLAAKLGLDAELVACTYAPLGNLDITRAEKAAARKRLLAERETAVRASIDKYRSGAQSVRLKVIWEKDLHSWISTRCGSGGYEMVIKTGNRSESLVHTSLDWQLLRECPADVMIVAARRWHRSKPVLASLDLGSKLRGKRELNHRVLARAKYLAASLGVQLEIIAAIEVPVLLSDLDLVDPGSYARDAKKAMRPHIEELASAHDLPAGLFYCKRGPVARVIADRAARLDAQLVVVGTVGRKGVKARLLGNTAETVLRHLKTDVLAVKP